MLVEETVEDGGVERVGPLLGPDAGGDRAQVERGVGLALLVDDEQVDAAVGQRLEAGVEVAAEAGPQHGDPRRPRGPIDAGRAGHVTLASW